MTLAGRTVLITGASRGIGREIALRCARDGANVVLAAKSSMPHPKLPGTIHTVARDVEAAGGRALPVRVDVRSEEDVRRAVDEAVAAFGAIDVLVHNAGAIHLAGLDGTTLKKFDLMMGVNARALFLCAQACLPHLERSRCAHVVSLAPPLSWDPRWIAGREAYTLSKYGMTILSLGLAQSLRSRRISVTTLWPRTLIATAAIDMLLGEQGRRRSRTPEIVADAVYQIATTEDLALTGRSLYDEDLLRERGVTDFSRYRTSPDDEPAADLYVGDPWE
jgi:citronellol/citronellal dehydrogenase